MNVKTTRIAVPARYRMARGGRCGHWKDSLRKCGLRSRTVYAIHAHYDSESERQYSSGNEFRCRHHNKKRHLMGDSSGS